MPGIAGIITTDAVQEKGQALEAMVKRMVHDRSHGSGTYVHKRMGLWAGWVCHDPSACDLLPIWNEGRDICLIFAGEHYCDNSRAEGTSTTSPAPYAGTGSLLVQLYEEKGSGFFNALNGTFAGVLVDLRENKVVLFNDRFGLGRIYFHQNADGFYFASEAKALLRVLPELRELDPRGLGEFFACGAVLQNRTLFTRVSLLPGGSAWTFRPKQRLVKGSYFDRSSWENQAALSPSDYYEKLNSTFKRVLPRYFGGKQRITLSLTGGLDSRMILACAPSGPRELPCHTFGGMYRECADVKLAKRIARICQQDHEVIPISSKFFSDFPALAEQSVYYTDGAMDVTGAVELFVNRGARGIAPVRLTGNYGSEILRGNVAFKPGHCSASIFAPSFLPSITAAAETYDTEREGSRTSFIVFKQVPWHHYARLAVEQSQITVRSPFLDQELVALAYQAPSEVSMNKVFAHRLIAENDPRLGKIPSDRGRLTLSCSTEGKLRKFCQEFMPRVEYAFDYGMPQWLAKFDRCLAPLRLERLFLGRHKFYHFRVWYRDELSTFVKEMLLDPRTLNRPYLNGKQVETIVRAHLGGHASYTVEIHKLLTSEFIRRQLVEQN